MLHKVSKMGKSLLKTTLKNNHLSSAVNNSVTGEVKKLKAPIQGWD